MTQERLKPQVTHYIPKFVLRLFRDERLFELDISTGVCSPKSIDNGAGCLPGFYSDFIEKRVMEKWDTAACNKVFRPKIVGRKHIALNHEERRILSTWLGLFFVRSPFNRKQMTLHIDATVTQTDEMLDLLRKRFIYYLLQVRAEKPHLYRKLRSLLGTAGVKQYIFDEIQRQICERPERHVPDVQDAFDWHINSGSFEHFGAILGLMAWTWIHCSTELVIGDAVVCRWHVSSSTPHYGIHKDGVEITVPLTRHLCLLIRQPTDGITDGDNTECDEARTTELNTRQIQSATRTVYAPYRYLLKKEAEFGFD